MSDLFLMTYLAGNTKRVRKLVPRHVPCLSPSMQQRHATKLQCKQTSTTGRSTPPRLIAAGGNNEARTCQIAKLNVDFVLIHDFC